MAESAYARELRPLITIMRLLGWLPLHRVPNTSTLEFRFFSLATFYSLSILFCTALLTFKVLFVKISVIQNIEPSTQLVAYMFLYLNIFLQILHPMVMVQARALGKYFNAWNTFQAKFEKVSISREPLSFGLIRWSYGWTSVSLLYGIYLILQRMLVTGIMPSLVDLLLSCGSVNALLLVTWMLCNCFALKATSNRLLTELKLLKNYSENGQFTSLLDRAVLNLRDPWLQLCHLVKEVGNTLALAECTLLFMDFVVLVYALFECMVYKSLGPKLFFTSWIFMTVSISFIFGHLGHTVQVKVFQGLLEAAKITKTLQISNSSKKKMHRFLLHLSQRSPKVSLGGYVTLDHSLFTTLLVSLFTNLAVLLQLDLKQKSVNFEDFFHLGNISPSL